LKNAMEKQGSMRVPVILKKIKRQNRAIHRRLRNAG